MRIPTALILLTTLAILSACGGITASLRQSTTPVAAREKANDVVMYALGLIETGYRFGGKNPEAGLDCSGMVSHVFKQAAGVPLKGSAVDIAKQGRPIERNALQPGDLVFFNTTGTPYSHVGIYIGDQRFVHSPSNGGKVRTDSLASGWFSSRIEATRSYFD